MNAVEKLQEAIVKLQLLKNHMTKGEWWRDELIRPTSEFDFGVFNGRVRVAISQGVDADVIVTLHRTIDAQIAVLRDAQSNYWEPGRAPDDWESFESSKASLALAEAILGDDA